MNELHIIVKLLAFAETPILIVALLVAYKIGEVARGVLYIIVIMLVKGLVDSGFSNGFLEFYQRAPEEYKMVLGVSWYFFYVLTGTIGLAALFLMVKIRPFLIKKYMVVYVSFRLLAIFIVFSRMLEIAYFESNYTKYPYMYGAQFLIHASYFLIAWGLLDSYRKSKEFGERIEWM